LARWRIEKPHKESRLPYGVKDIQFSSETHNPGGLCCRPFAQLGCSFAQPFGMDIYKVILAELENSVKGYGA
jgi:hypothetical protein